MEVIREEKQDEDKSRCQKVLGCLGISDALKHPTSNMATEVVTMATTTAVLPSTYHTQTFKQKPPLFGGIKPYPE